VSALRAREASPPYLAQVADQLRQVTLEVYSPDGGGAGVLWAPDLVVTNAHVARAANVRVGLVDGRQVEARLLGADRDADLALLHVSPCGLTPAVLGDSDDLRVGSLVVALGHPLGLRRTLTTGVVHALPAAGPDGRRFIHADVHLAPGNSGGPLADTTGRVVGINTMIAGGLALAIPVNDACRFVAAHAPGPT
jgi:serine protease Do